MSRGRDEEGKDHLLLNDTAERKRLEEELRESEERYRTLFEQSRDAIYITSRDGTIVDANRSMLELFGYTREEFMGLLAQDTYADPAQRRRYQREIEAKGAVRDYEVKLRKKDGTEMDCLVTSTLRRANDGSIAGYQGIIRDITERKRVEEELIRLSSAVKMSVDSIAITDLEGRIIEANEAALKMYGTDEKSDLIGEYFFDLVPPEQREIARAAIEGVLEKGYDRTRELDIITKDGSRIPVEISASILKDGDGNPIGLVGISRDISEQRQAAEALHGFLEETTRTQRLLVALSHAAETVQRCRTREEVCRTILDEIANLGYHALIFTLTEDRTHLAVSYLTFESAMLRAAEKLTGLSTRNYQFPLVHRGFFDRIIFEGETNFTEPMAPHLAEALPEPVRPLAGRLADLLGLEQMIIAPLKADGEVHALLVVTGTGLTPADASTVSIFANQAAIAIENARLYQSARKSIDELTGLLMSHELRGPLTNIKAASQTWASLLSDGIPVQRELLSIVEQESDRLVWFLDRIQRIATLEAGMATPEWREVSVRALVAKAADPRSLPQHSHRLDVLVEEGLTVRADEGWAMMTIRNLLENAIKHCPPGSHVQVRGSRMDENWAKITVADNGPGLAASDVEQIFRKFYRGQAAIHQGISGQGLGLYLVRLLVEAQGGRVSVHSEEGNGASFSFTLPLAH